MKLFYSVYEAPSYIEKQQGRMLGACITEGEDRAKTIEDAENYYCNRMEEDGEYGEGEQEAVLVFYNEDNGAEKLKDITLTWHAERDTYDGGRFDYLAGIGAIRSF